MLPVITVQEAPVNALVAERVHRALRDKTAAGTLGDADLLATIPGLTAERPPDRAVTGRAGVPQETRAP